MRFSASGPNPAALTDDLSGNGDIRLSQIRLPEADPAALDRALVRALAEDDPLRDGRPQALVSEEFSAAPLVAKGPATAAVTLVGGMLRSAPFGLDLGPARWNGTFGVDLRSGSLDAKEFSPACRRRRAGPVRRLPSSSAFPVRSALPSAASMPPR
ncbi:hypothetical protein ACFQWF_16215 [Methylorubrum suomiense]